MLIEELPLSSVKPYEKNPRKNEEAVAGVAESIKQFGFQQPIVIDKDGVIVAGHTRYKAAKRLGLKTVPCVRASALSPEQIKAYRILDNKLNEKATWDFETLSEELQSFKFNFEEFKVDFPKFDFKFESSLPSEKEIDETPFPNEARGALTKDFIVPPFSVLNSRSGEWQDRKRAYEILLDSGSGRDTNLLGHMHYCAAKIGSRLTGTSVFDPVLCELLYQWFCPKNGSIIDPFAGGSVRGIVAGFLEKQYTGIDLSQRQIEANMRENDRANKILDAKDFNYIEPRWICGDSREILRLLPPNSKFDFLVACPPYFDLEQYSDDPKDLSNADWESFLVDYRKIFKDSVSTLNENSFAAVIISEVRNKKSKNGEYINLVGETIRALRDAGTEYYNELVLVNAVGSGALRARGQFAPSRKIVKLHQNVLVFVKGSAKDATQKLGNVDNYLAKCDFEDVDEVGDTVARVSN